MEREPGQDPEHDGPADPRSAEGSPGPDDAGLPDDAGSPAPAPAPAPAPGAPGADADADASAGSSGADADADAGSDGHGESVFGPWDALEGTLGAAREREELLAGFAPGGVWDKHPPGPELAVAVAKAAGPDWRCGLATGEEMIGLLRAMAALQSWSGAGLLGMVRALIRDDDEAFLGRPRHGDLPDEWDDSLVHEIALALAVSAPSAGRTTQAAWELGARLPGVELLLRDGTLDLPRARLVTEVFGELSDENAARAEELLLPELTAPPRKTYTQVERIATAIAAAVDPELAERRRKAAEKHRSRVTVFRESSGAAGLSGRDLPVDETLAAYASLDARARLYKDSGAFPGERTDRLRATAYLDILNGISADDRIACGHLSSDPDPDPDTGPGDAPNQDGPADHGGPVGGGPRSGGSDCPCDECDGRCTPPDDSEPDDDEPDDGEPGEDEPRDGDDPDHGGPGGPGGGQPPGGDHPDTGHGNEGPQGGGADGRSDCDGRGNPDGPGTRGSDDPADDGPGRPSHSPRSPFSQSASGTSPTLTDLVLPLATLLAQAERPGEGHGLGTLDPALCRALAVTATLSPHTTLCLTVTDPEGIAIGHGCAKTGRLGRLARPPDGPAPPLVALPARINLTITAARLAAMLASPDPPESGAAGGWAIVPSDAPRAGSTRAASGTGTVTHVPGTTVARRPQRPPGDPDWCRTWTLTLPSGLQTTVHLEPVPTYECDHRNESHAYKPNATLRHLVQIRDYVCTFPPCSRHARESDFEHAVPYDQGGRTCGCNAGARSRKCHRIKQSPGWNVTQPQPGSHQWTTPRGRTYTQGPKHYPV
jgi:Domain of unknown function (DUF222)